MADPLERKIEQRLLAGESKEDIWHDMKNDAEPEKTLFYLNNKARLKDRLSFHTADRD